MRRRFVEAIAMIKETWDVATLRGAGWEARLVFGCLVAGVIIDLLILF